jgi:hypothetical protein
LKSAGFSDSELNMAAAPKMRDLAHRLLAYEAVAGKTSELAESPTLRVYEKLRQSLGEFAGVAGFQAFASRALTQAKSEAPGLWAVRVAPDGSLQGLGEFRAQPGEFEPQLGSGNDQAGEGGVVLIARLLGLLRIFLGEALTLSLLRVTWPGAAFDDSNSENGRKA